MKTRRWLVFFIFFALLLGPRVAQANQSSDLSEQLHFSAEDTGVKHPVDIPKDVLTILSKDGTVESVLENENIKPVDLPGSWFSASALHLNGHTRRDLIVVGQPPVSGGSVAMFWVFHGTTHGYELVLAAAAHNLIIRNTRWKGYRDIELRQATAGQVSTILCRFNGKQYTKYAAKSEPIH